MKTREITFTLLLAAGFISIAQAQPPGGGGWNRDPEEVAARQTEQMSAQLGLSAEQLEQVKAINLKYAKKSQEARNAAAGDFSQMREIMTAINNEKNEELKQILSQEQMTKWQQFQEEQRAQRGQWNQGQGQGQRPQAPPSEEKPQKKNKKKKSGN